MVQSDVVFCDQFVRPFADRRAQGYYAAKALVQIWTARGGATAIPNTSAVVPDSASTIPLTGSGSDGRPIITGVMVNNMINRATEIITDYEATSNAKLTTVLQVAVNPHQNT